MSKRLFLLRLLIVTILSSVETPTFGLQYVKTTKSPYKFDPPGTYIETRSDGTRNYYRGGVRYQTENRSGNITPVQPPTYYSVKQDGTLWKTEYQGLNEVGNKTYSESKVADMIPNQYAMRGTDGAISGYNIREYLSAHGGVPEGLSPNMNMAMVVIGAQPQKSSLAYFPAFGDPCDNTGYIALRFKGWPLNIQWSEKYSDPVLTLMISVDMQTFEIPALMREDSESTYWAFHLPSGRHNMALKIALHELSFSDMEAEESGEKQLKCAGRGTYDYSRIARYEEELEQYCFAHNISHNLRLYTFIHCPQYLTTQMQVYAPHGTVKVVDVDLSGVLERDDPGWQWWGQTGSGYKVLQKLYHDPDFDDRDLFVWHIDQPPPKSEWQLLWQFRSYNAKPATWEIDNNIAIPSITSFDEWLCDNRLKLITLGEMIEPTMKGDYTK